MPKIERTEIEKKVKEILAKELGIKSENITPDKKLIEDLGMDSFASVELMFELEEKLEISIPESEARNLISVKDIINYIASHLLEDTSRNE
jgi:acyl carrier protein